MKVKTVTLTRVHKINIGNYENLSVGASIVAEVEENDGLVHVSEELEASLDDVLDKPVERVLRLAEHHPKINESHTWDYYEYD
jgi:hypothetical protein